MDIPEVRVIETFARMLQALPVVRKFLIDLALSPSADGRDTPVQLTTRGLLDRAACWFGSTAGRFTTLPGASSRLQDDDRNYGRPRLVDHRSVRQ